MKKVLFATTALVMSAGYAAADVTISGSANAGFKYDEGGLGYAPSKKAAAWYEIDMDVVGTIESDAGLTFGASVDLDSDSDSDNKSQDGEVFMSGSFGTFTIGELDPIGDDYGLSDIGLDGIGVDDVAEDSSGYTTSADIRWDYAVGAVTLGVSADTVSEDYDLGAKYDAGMFWGALVYSHDEDYTATMDNNSVQLTVGGSFDAFGAELYVADSDAGDTSYGVYGSYTTGALTLAAAYAKNDADDEGYGIDAAYDLGGATVKGGVGKVMDDTVADFGVKFSF
ncbi:hypothetical protein BFP70_06520 [Thioclava sp. SK-1]|uniref:porin n=1 Tax=Thioclava sp. SK-1 TaxID=1889770 RepID=UPI00082710D5|nr:porin [Thioclava sp. SK-1]OCX65793.1 hypothetical protein BFP70_06520 [Thioclava sp. SK-1]